MVVSLLGLRYLRQLILHSVQVSWPMGPSVNITPDSVLSSKAGKFRDTLMLVCSKSDGKRPI